MHPSYDTASEAINDLQERGSKKLKGIVVNAHGIYSSYRSQKLIEHINTPKAL